MTTDVTTSQPAARAAAAARRDRRWLMLVVLLLGQFMALLDVTIVNVAMPTIGTDLHASGAALQLVVAGYMVSYAMLLITGARLGSVYGQRRIFLAGVPAFTAMSLVCGVAPDTGVLVGARFVQGAGAALMMPQIISVIQLAFDGADRARALSAYTAVIAVGAVAGQVLGGVLVSADLLGLGWRAVFLVNVPIGIVVLALLPRVLPTGAPMSGPANGPRRAGRRLDLAGLAVIVPAVFLVVLPLVLGHQEGWPWWVPVGVIAGCLLAGVFLLVERGVAARGGDPLLRLDVLRAPGLGAGLAALALAMIGYGGFLFALALHLQAGLGDSALRAGLTFGPTGAAFGLSGFYWRRLPEGSHRLLTPVGFAVGAACYLALALALRSGGHGGVPLLLALTAFGVGVGAGFGALMTHAVARVPAAEAADASGLLTTTLQLGQVVGVATFGSLYLSLAAAGGTHPSAHAIAVTFGWLGVLLATGAAAAIPLARAARRPGRVAGTP